MAVVKANADGIISNRIKPQYFHMALARNKLFLMRRMALHFCAWTFDPQILSLQSHLSATRKHQRKTGFVGRKSDFIGPIRIGHALIFS
jgi:hypothetical protein